MNIYSNKKNNKKRNLGDLTNGNMNSGSVWISVN